MTVAERAGNTFLVILSPVVLGWTLHSFWRLATLGTLTVRDHGDVIEVSGGLNFWVTLWLYAVLCPGSIVVIWMFATWLARRLRGRE